MQVGKRGEDRRRRVGTISDIRPTTGLAQLVMDVKSEVLPAQRRDGDHHTQDLLGERYIALDRGTAAAPQLGEPA